MLNENVFFCNYSIGQNVYKEVDRVCKIYGKRVLLIGGKKGMESGKALLEAALAESKLEIVDAVLYGKDCTAQAIEKLTEYGYTVVKPDGAFYLFVKALEDNASAFCERAKDYELLLVPSDDFGCGGFVRVSYCVKTEQIEKSLPAFRALADSYKNC